MNAHSLVPMAITTDPASGTWQGGTGGDLHSGPSLHLAGSASLALALQIPTGSPAAPAGIDL